MEAGIALTENTLYLAGWNMAFYLALSIVAGVVIFLALARPKAIFGFRRSGGSSGRKLGLFLGTLGCLAILIFPVLLAIQEGNGWTVAPLMGVRLLQAVVLDNGFVDYISGPPQGGLATVYYLLIGLCYVLLPILAAFNVYDLIMQHLSNLRLLRIARFTSRKKSVYLINDFNSNTHGLARDILKRDDRSLVVFSGMSKKERDEWSTELAQLDSDRAICLESSFTDVAVSLCDSFKFDRLRCIAVSDKSAKDIAETCKTIELLRGLGEGDKRCVAMVGKGNDARRNRVRLYVACDSPDDELVVDAANKKGIGHPDHAGSLQIMRINEAAMTAYSLLENAPLFEVLGNPEPGEDGLRPARKTNLDVIIIGSGRYAEELLKAVLWCGQMHNIRLNVEIADVGAEGLRDRTMLRCPELLKDDYYNLEFTPVDPLSPAIDELCLSKHVGSENLYVISAIEDDALSHELAMHVRLFFLSHGPNMKIDVGKKPFITCLIRDDAMCSLVSARFDEDLPGYGITPFGSRSKLFSYAGVIDSPLESAGQFANDVYNVLYSGISKAGELDLATETINVAALRDCVENIADSGLPMRRSTDEFFGGISCERQIIHQSNLALALHSRYKAWAIGGSPLSDDTCVALGQNEHNRWVVFYRTQGFSYMTPKEQETYSRELTGKNTRHKIEPLRKHSLMCPNDAIWSNYLHSMGGFSYIAPSRIAEGVTRLRIMATLEGGKIATGLKLQLLDSEYAVIEEWRASSEAHMTVGLPDGSYILHPASAAEGLRCADDLAFNVHDGCAFIGGESTLDISYSASGDTLVNPIVYDWAFAIAAPRLAELAE